MLLNHRSKSIFLVNILINIVLVHFYPHMVFDLPLIFWKQTERQGRGDHDVSSLSRLLSMNLFSLREVSDTHGGVEWLLLGLELVFVETLIFFT